jgi:hypothetical protein
MACKINPFRRRIFRKNPEDDEVVEDVAQHIEKALKEKKEVAGFRSAEFVESGDKKSARHKLPDVFSYIKEDVTRRTETLYQRYCSMTERPPFFDKRFEEQRELWCAPKIEMALNLRTNYLDILAIQLHCAVNRAIVSDKQESMNYIAGYQDDLVTIALYFACMATIWRYRTWGLKLKGVSLEDFFGEIEDWIGHETGSKFYSENYQGHKRVYHRGKNAIDSYDPYRKGKVTIAKDGDEADDEEIEAQEQSVNKMGIRENSFRAHINRHVNNVARTITKQVLRKTRVQSAEEPYGRGMISLDSMVGEDDEGTSFADTVAGKEDYLIDLSKLSQDLIDKILKTLIGLVDPIELYKVEAKDKISLREYVLYRLWNANSFNGAYTNREVNFLYRWGTRPWTLAELRQNGALKGTMRNDKYYTSETHAVKLLVADFWKIDMWYVCSKCGKALPVNIQHCKNSTMTKTEVQLTYQDKYRVFANRNWSETVRTDMLYRVKAILLAKLRADGLISRPTFHEFESHREEAGLRVPGKPVAKEQAPIRHISVEDYLQEQGQ